MFQTLQKELYSVCCFRYEAVGDKSRLIRVGELSTDFFYAVRKDVGLNFVVCV